MQVKSDVIKKQHCIGAWNVRSLKDLTSRQFGSGQTGNGKSEHHHFRKQVTKIDWNG